VTWAAEQGIGQFLDLGAGLPTVQNTHQAARAVNPAAVLAGPGLRAVIDPAGPVAVPGDSSGVGADCRASTRNAVT
jgi:hypothetical protein